MIKQILVPVDDSPPSAAALATAIEIAAALNATITLLGVVDTVGRWVAGPFGAISEVIEEDTASEHTRRRRVLRLAAERIPDEIPFRLIFTDGEPAEQIIRQARSGDYDLVVIGARGLGTLRAAMAGGVSRRVVSASEIPVTVVRAAPDVLSFTEEPESAGEAAA